MNKKMNKKGIEGIPIYCWIVAIACDLIQLVPFFDILITSWAQYILWVYWMKRKDLFLISLTEDIGGDFIVGVGDLIPLNTIMLFMY